jgi:cytochrome c oxidase assembly factor CtaG
LYATSGEQHAHWGLHNVPAAPSLADQQLAGLLMIAACPLSYLLAGLVIASRMIKELGRLDHAGANHQAPVFGGQ